MKRSYDQTLADFDVRRPWVRALLFIMCIPVFPEYVAPVLALLAAIGGIRDVRKRHQTVRIGTTGVVMLVYLCYMTVHLLWAEPWGISAGTVALWWVLFSVYLTLVNVIADRDRMEVALLMLSMVAGMLGILAIVQYLSGMFFSQAIPLRIWDFADIKVYALFPTSVSLNYLGVRSSATFTNPNLFAVFLILVLPFVAAYAFTGQRSAAKIVSRLSLLCMVGGLLVTFSRGCYLAFGAIAIVMCIANIRRLVPILIVAMSVVLLIPDTVYERLMSVGNASDVAILERFDVWGISMQLFFERPLFGYGAGIGETWARMAQNGIGAPHAHNLFVEWLAEGGIFALLLLLFLIWKLFRIGFEMIIHTKKTRMFGAAIIAFCAGLCVSGMFDYPLSTVKTAGTFFVALALMDVFGRVELSRTTWRFAQLPLIDSLLRLWARVFKKQSVGGDLPA